MATDFVLVVTAAQSVAFDADTFSNACPQAPHAVYVTIDFDGDGLTDVLGPFGVGGLKPKTTVLYAIGAGGPDAESRIATALGMPADEPISRPANLGEFCAALSDTASRLVSTAWQPPGFYKLQIPQFHANTTGIVDAQGVFKSVPQDGYTSQQISVGTYEILNTSSARIGNLLMIPSTYAPPLEGGLQVITDNFFWKAPALPDAFNLRPVGSLVPLTTPFTRRSYRAGAFAVLPIQPPTQSSKVWRADFVYNPSEAIGQGNAQAYLWAEDPGAPLRWYGAVTVLEQDLFEIPSGKMMRLTRITPPPTAGLLTAMRTVETSYLP